MNSDDSEKQRVLTAHLDALREDVLNGPRRHAELGTRIFAIISVTERVSSLRPDAPPKKEGGVHVPVHPAALTGPLREARNLVEDIKPQKRL